MSIKVGCFLLYFVVIVLAFFVDESVAHPHSQPYAQSQRRPHVRGSAQSPPPLSHAPFPISSIRSPPPLTHATSPGGASWTPLPVSPVSPVPGPSGIGHRPSPLMQPLRDVLPGSPSSPGSAVAGPSWASPQPVSSPGAAVASPSQPERTRSPKKNDPYWLGRPHYFSRLYTGLLHPTLLMLKAGPGEPGSPENPGTIQAGPSQQWLASAFHRGFIPRERFRRLGQLCNERTICEEGSCCLQIIGKPRLCHPVARRGDPCSPRALTNVYVDYCFCGYNEDSPAEISGVMGVLQFYIFHISKVSINETTFGTSKDMAASTSHSNETTFRCSGISEARARTVPAFKGNS
ncbi:uncharacterized protein LOC142764860 isoform X3 [Rhipicephalus microplus]|uniref:uncharacterized protein LOC142764860 isoform X3 n=1 Tax=Rhipicephalus microplus TaxID=6941 RepID=UPI003F6C3B87